MPDTFTFEEAAAPASSFSFEEASTPPKDYDSAGGDVDEPTNEEIIAAFRARQQARRAAQQKDLTDQRNIERLYGALGQVNLDKMDEDQQVLQDAAALPATILNQPQRAANVLSRYLPGNKEPAPDPFQPGKPIIRLPRPTGTNALAGVGQLASDTISGFTTPEMIMAGPAAAESALVRALFGAQIATQLPDQVQHAAATLSDTNATPAAKAVAVGEPLVNAGFGALIAKSGEAGPRATGVKPTEKLSEPVSEPVPSSSIGPVSPTEIPSEPFTFEQAKEPATFTFDQAQSPPSHSPTIPLSTPEPEPDTAPLATPGQHANGTPLEVTINAGSGVRTVQGTATDAGVQIGEHLVLPWESPNLLSTREIKADTSPEVEGNTQAAERMARESEAANAALRARKTESEQVGGGESEPSLPSPSSLPSLSEKLLPVDVSEADIKRHLDRTEPAPDILDDIRDAYPSGIKFPAADHAEQVKQFRAAAPEARLKKLANHDTGEPADQALKGFHEEGQLLDITTPDELADEMVRAAKARRQASPEARAAALELAREEKRHQAWEENSQRASRPGSEPVPVNSLFVGDELKFGGHKMRVTEWLTDPETGQPTGAQLEGTYGRKVVPVGETLHPDSSPTPHLEDKLDTLKIDMSGGQLHAFGLLPEVWNKFLSDVQEQVRAGREQWQAIREGLAKLKAQFPAFDSAAALAHLRESLSPDQSAPSDQSAPTGIRNAITDQEREARGLPAAVSAARRDFGTVWDEAAAKMQSGSRGGRAVDNLIAELAAKPRALTDVEDAMLLHRQVELQNEHGQLSQALAEAHDSGRLDKFEENKLQLARVSDELVQIYDVNRAAGTETGRGLAARAMLARQDFTLAKMETDLRAAQDGAPLDDTQRQQLEAAHAKINETQAKLDEALARLDQAKADRASRDSVADLVDQVKGDVDVDPAVQSLAERITRKLESAAEAARARIRARRAHVSSGIDPTLISDYGIVMASHIARGTLEFSKASRLVLLEFGEEARPYLKAAWEHGQRIVDDTVDTMAAGPKRDKVSRTVRKLDTRTQREALLNSMKGERLEGTPRGELGRYVQRLAETFVRDGIKDRDALIDAVHQLLVLDFDPSISRRQAMDAISGYGEFRQLNPDAVKAELRDLKGQMQQVAKLEDIQAKRPLQKTGIERRTQSDTERRLIKEVNDLKKRLGVVVDDPAKQLKSALDAIKTRMRNRIADLKYEMASKTRLVREKGAVKFDAEAEALKMDLEAAQKEHAEIFQRPDLTDDQRLEMATKAVQKSIAEYEARLKARDASPLQRIGRTPKTAALDALRARRDALRAEFRELQAVDPGFKAEQEAKAHDLAKSKITAGITELSARIDARDFGDRPKSARTTSAELTALRDQRAALWKEYRRLEKEYNPTPKRSPEEVALQAAKTRLANSTADYRERIARGDLEPRQRKPITLDAEATRLKAENQTAKQAFQRTVVQARLAGRPGWEKFLNGVVRWQRFSLLSAPATIVKLSAAAAARAITTPIEEVIGAGYSKVLPTLAERAPREGYLNVKAEAQALMQGVTKGMVDAWQTLKTGESELSRLYGKNRDAAVAEHDVMPNTWRDFFGNLHGALKAPIKRAEWARSFQKRMEFNIRAGVDVTNPLVETRIALEAYADAQRSIFLQDNQVVSAYKRMLSAFEQPNKATGRVSIGSKLTATGIRTALPIVRVPTNLVSETFAYALGFPSGITRLVWHGAGPNIPWVKRFARDLKSLTPEEADMVLRHLKKGTIGPALLLAGFFLPQAVGGYYQKREKRDARAAKPGHLLAGEADVPEYVLHSPALENLQIGATARHVADSVPKRGADPRGVGAGVWAAGLGLAEKTPLVGDMFQVSSMEQTEGAAKYVGEVLKSRLIPQIVQAPAKWLDRDASGETVKRDPRTLGEQFKTAIPGLRQQVPAKRPSRH